MSIRSVVGKLGRVTCNTNITRNITINIRGSEASMASAGSAYSSRHPFDSGDHANRVLHQHHHLHRRIRRRHNLSRDQLQRVRAIRNFQPIIGGPGRIQSIRASSPDILPLAHFAVEEFNKQKDAQLQFVRVVRVSRQGLFRRKNFITIEAIDAADHHGVVKVYQATVVWEVVSNSMELRLFGLVVDDGSLLKLIDNRGGRFDGRGRQEKGMVKVPRIRRGYPVEDEMLSTLRMFPLQRNMAFLATAEACDTNTALLARAISCSAPMFQMYGQCQAFSGPIVTLKVFEDNVLVRELLKTRGEGRVLVIDGG